MELGWYGRNSEGPGWTGMNWDGLGWTGMALGWTGLDWEGLGWTGMDWDGMEGTGRDWDGLGWHWEELGWTGLNWERQPPHPLHESLPPPPPPPFPVVHSLLRRAVSGGEGDGGAEHEEGGQPIAAHQRVPHAQPRRLEDAHEEDVEVQPLQAHPRESGQEGEVQQPRHHRARRLHEDTRARSSHGFARGSAPLRP